MKPHHTHTLLPLLALLTALAGCGKNTTTTPATPSAPATATPPPQTAPAAPGFKPLTLPSYKQPGAQFSEFSTLVLNSITNLQKLAQGKDHATDMPMSLLPIIQALITPGTYDALEKGAPKDNKTGPLMMSNWNGARTRSGDEIRGTATRAYDTTTGGYFAGDKLTNTTTLNMPSNLLTIETKTTNDGAPRTREFYEILILPDKTILAQSYTAQRDPYDKTTIKATASFYQFNADKKTFKSIFGKLKTPALDFPHDTLSGKTAPDIAALAAAAALATPSTVTFDGDTITTH